MNLIKTTRILGDALSCMFSSDGSLSTARLTVGGREYDVVGQLPGLNESNSQEYLERFGYLSVLDEDCVLIARLFEERLEGSKFFVESVEVGGPEYGVHVVLREQRDKVCPQLLFCAFCNEGLSNFRFETVRDYKVVSEFLDLLKRVGSGRIV